MRTDNKRALRHAASAYGESEAKPYALMRSLSGRERDGAEASEVVYQAPPSEFSEAYKMIKMHPVQSHERCLQASEWLALELSEVVFIK